MYFMIYDTIWYMIQKKKKSKIDLRYDSRFDNYDFITVGDQVEAWAYLHQLVIKSQNFRNILKSIDFYQGFSKN